MAFLHQKDSWVNAQASEPRCHPALSPSLSLSLSLSLTPPKSKASAQAEADFINSAIRPVKSRQIDTGPKWKTLGS
jgi:hypothetical protein